MKTIAEILGDYQELFPFYKEYEKYFYDELTSDHKLVLHCLEVIETSKYSFSQHQGKGRPPHSRSNLFRSLIAKSILRIPTNKDLISRLESDRNLKRICGYQNEDVIPHESCFSRAFAEFAELHILELHHNEMIKTHVSDEIIGHLSRDSTAIKSREKPVNKKKDVIPKVKRKRGRPKKEEVVAPKEPSNLEKQLVQSVEESLSELNQDAAWGVKKNSQGKVNAWKGYKLHLDVTDVGIPITAVLTGANVHDSQLAIPMEKIAESKCIHLYSLMDAAYDAEHIHNYITGKGRVPVIDENKRRKEKIGFDPAKKERYKIRSTVERCNSHLKDWLFGQAIYVKGHSKVMSHLMFGILALTAMKILQYGY